MASMMDLNLYHWDVRNKGNPRIGLLERLEGKVEIPFSDLDASDNVSVGEVPKEPLPSKKHRHLPFPEDKLVVDSSDDLDYVMDNQASLEQCCVRKLPRRKTCPVGSFAEE